MPGVGVDGVAGGKDMDRGITAQLDTLEAA